MQYNNKSRNELISIINKRNNTIELLEQRIEELEKLLKSVSNIYICNVLQDINKQRQEISRQNKELKILKSELLQIILDQ